MSTVLNELDKLYTPSFWSKRLPQSEICEFHINFIENASRNAILKIPSQLNVKYGLLPREKLDIFGTDLQDDAPIFIFIHGGYWQIKQIKSESYAFIAEHFHKKGIKTILIDYELCPDVTLPEIVKNVETAAKWCIDYAKKKKSKGLYFSGHSAGAHLVASLFNNFFKLISLKEQAMAKAAILVSGVYDLLPVQKTIVNDPLGMDEAMALKMSPAKHNISNEGGTVFYTVVGGDESPEFLKQSKEFQEKLNNLGVSSRLLVVDDVDHFNIIELLSEDDFVFTRYIIDIILSKGHIISGS